MKRRLLKSKIHRARVTGADLDYTGSVTVDAGLLEAADILERRPSKNSTMPIGLLDTLKKEEVLELLSYLLASARPGAGSTEKTPR